MVNHLMPDPFAWVEIPAGTVRLRPSGHDRKYYTSFNGNTIFEMPAFTISKYSITNAQYARFIEANGYHEQRWWTEKGWAQREALVWSEPLFWQDAIWNGAEHPVVGVSWYESLAFCAWLSEVTGEDIQLVSDKQWQRAAQGQKRLTYPWGSTWDETRCNNASEGTTRVRQFEGLGDSPYGVVDMSGNVWEWCRTEYVFDDPDYNKSDGRSCMLRGGSWVNSHPDDFTVIQRNGWLHAYDRSQHVGFRCVHVTSEQP